MSNKLRNLLVSLTSLMSNKSLAAGELVLLEEEVQLLKKYMAGISLQDLFICPEKLTRELQVTNRLEELFLWNNLVFGSVRLL